jgi:hypothetical protein
MGNLVNKNNWEIQLLADKEFNSEFIKQYSICKSQGLF